MNDTMGEIPKMTRRNFLKFTGAALISGAVSTINPVKTAASAASPIEGASKESAESQRLKNNIADYLLVTREIVEKNTKEGKIIPSSAYSNGEWVRDAAWTILGAEDISLGSEFFKRALKTQQTNGQIPTCRFDDGNLQIKDDESTQAIILLAIFLKNKGYNFSPSETASIVKALEYCSSHLDRQGFWRTKNHESFQTWHDTVVFDKDDVPTYVQGITAAAFEAGKRLFPYEKKWQDLASKTREAYNGLYPELKRGKKYLPLSQKRPRVVDVSSLFGEFLSLQLFNAPLLTDEIVLNTFTSFKESKRVGFKVVANEDGSYLSPDEFEAKASNAPGAYQNGASWFAYDMAALLAAGAHNADVVKMISDRIEAEFKYKNGEGKNTLWEYLETNPESPNFGRAPDIRMGYSWNIVCRPLLKRLASNS